MRKLVRSAVIFPAALALASCSAASTGDNAPSSTPSLADEQAMMAGEPVALHGGNTTPAPFTITAHGAFDEPWAISVEPVTGRLFITGKKGAGWIYEPKTGRVATVVRGLPTVGYGGQGGMGDVAFAPSYSASGEIYFSWAETTEGDARLAVVGRGRLACRLDECEVVGLQQIWRQSQAPETPGHFSYKLAVTPTHLWVSSGERMLGDPAQSLASNLGKVVRLRHDGTPAPGNPFATQGGVAAEVWSYGHRNLTGLQFDASGQLWNIEHGPRGGDELNRVVAGANYGWPVRSNGDNYNGDPIPDHTADDGFTKPAIFWNPVIAPGDFVFYRGSAFAGWQGNAIIAGLGVGTLTRVAINADGTSASEVERWRMPRRLRDIVEAEDGSLWLIEDGPEGRLLHLVPGR